MATSLFLMIVLLLGSILSIIATNTAYAQEGGMIKTSSKGSLDIRLEPQWSEGGQASFQVSFLNPGTNTLHEHQDYDFRILKGGQRVYSAAEETGQTILHNVEGTLIIPAYTFQGSGNYSIQVYLAGIGLPAIPTDEEAAFPITVVPEFPTGGVLAAFLIASMTTAIVLSQRFKLV